MKHVVKIYCNVVLGGWNPNDKYQTSASELGIKELAVELAKQGHEVTVYHNGKHGEYKGAHFVDFSEFNPIDDCDMFISFKNRDVWEQTIDAKLRIHYTTEIEVFDNRQIDKYIVISEYHKKRIIEENPAIKDKVIVVPIGMYFRELDIEHKDGALYSSSPDRGLGSIVQKWSKDYPTLTVTFGWDKFELFNMNNHAAMLFRDNVIKRLTELDARQVGKLSIPEMDIEYSKAKYWTYPLEQHIPDSELMCQSALYAQLYHCTPVIRPVGALPETVKHYIEWDKWNGNDTITYEQKIDNFKHAKQYLWENIIKKWIELLELT